MPRRIMPDRTEAPVLLVIYRCPKCKQDYSLDAYQGPPRCKTNHPPEFMEPIVIDKSGSDPLADIKKMRSTERMF